YMTMQDDVDVGEPRWNFDFIGIDYHGNCQSHIDALCHCVYRGQLYTGVSPRRVTSQGAAVQAITATEHRIVTRRVLPDVPRARAGGDGPAPAGQPELRGPGRRLRR